MRMTKGKTSGATSPLATPRSVQMRTTSARTIMPSPTRKESRKEKRQSFAPSPQPMSLPRSAAATYTSPNARKAGVMRLKYSMFAMPMLAKKMGEKKRYPIVSTLDST